MAAHTVCVCVLSLPSLISYHLVPLPSSSSLLSLPTLTLDGALPLDSSNFSEIDIFVLPFSFNFYGTELDFVFVNPNGYLQAYPAPPCDGEFEVRRTSSLLHAV